MKNLLQNGRPAIVFPEYSYTFCGQLEAADRGGQTEDMEVD